MELNESVSIGNKYAYPLSVHAIARKDMVEMLYSTTHFVVDILPDEEYQITHKNDNNIKYIDVRGSYLNIGENNSETVKKIELEINDRDLRHTYTPSVFYGSDGEIYITEHDIHVIQMYSVDVIKSLLLKATTEKMIENKSRVRG